MPLKSAINILSSLSNKKRMFADLYVGGPDHLRGNAAKCYKHLHPNCKNSTAETEGPKTLRNPLVQEYLNEKVNRIQKETDINSQWVLDQAVVYFKQCIGELPHPVSVTVDTPEGKKAVQVMRKSFNAAGAGRALEIIGKHIAVQAFKERVDAAGNLDLAEIMGRRQKYVEERASIFRN